MVKQRLWQFGLAFLALILVAVPAVAVEQMTFTGEVTYRERIALPPNADLRVTLVSLDADGEAHAIGATAPIPARGQVPLQFALNVRSDAITSDQDYGLIAEISADGVVLFRNRTPALVDPTLPLPVLIIVNFDPPAVEAVPEPVSTGGELEVTAALFDTIWQVRTVGDHAVYNATDVSLSIAPDHRAGGNGGCNSYFTEAMFDGSALRFGPVAGTRMACDDLVMEQEAAFFAALEATAEYEVAGPTLYLLDTDGKELARLARQ